MIRFVPLKTAAKQRTAQALQDRRDSLLRQKKKARGLMAGSIAESVEKLRRAEQVEVLQLRRSVDCHAYADHVDGDSAASAPD